jgi:hypothetical protein
MSGGLTICGDAAAIRSRMPRDPSDCGRDRKPVPAASRHEGLHRWPIRPLKAIAGAKGNRICPHLMAQKSPAAACRP